jgi:hypothetical protein
MMLSWSKKRKQLGSFGMNKSLRARKTDDPVMRGSKALVATHHVRQCDKKYDHKMRKNS